MLYKYNMTDNIQDDKIFSALASPLRRRILDALLNHPRTTSQLCEQLPELGRCSVMQHLDVLENAGLIVAKRRGRHRWNYLDAIPIKRIYERWISPYAAEAVDRLDRLKVELEADSEKRREWADS